MQDAGLYILTPEKENSLSHREAVLKENKRIFAEQYRIDWNAVKEELDLKRRDEVRLGEK